MRLLPVLYASLYVAPGFRVKFFQGARLSPWGALGGGYGLYEEADRLSNGQVTSNRLLSRGVFDFGGGLDHRLILIRRPSRRSPEIFILKSEH